MASANINLTQSVPEEVLDVYGAGLGTFDICPTGVVVFAKASVALSKNDTVYVKTDGTVSKSTSSGAMAGVVECAAASGEGVWVKVLGTANSKFVVPSLGE